MPTRSGAMPPPANWPPAAPVKGENKLSPKGGTRGAIGSCVPSEGACCVPLVASLLEGVPAEPPARVLKTSAVALATLAAAVVAALWTVPTVLSSAPSALVPRLDERRNASPTAGAAGTAAATTAAVGMLLVNVVSGPPSPHGAIGAVAGSDTSPRTSAARPSE